MDDITLDLPVDGELQLTSDWLNSNLRDALYLILTPPTCILTKTGVQTINGSGGIQPVGTPARAVNASNSVTGSWGTGQVRTSGHVLVAVVFSAIASATVDTISTPSGWTLLNKVNSRAANDDTGTAHIWIHTYGKIASGSDSAPAFSTAHGEAMAAVLYELKGVDTSGGIGSIVDKASNSFTGTGSGTVDSSAESVTQTSLASSGELCIAAFGMNRSAASSNFTNDGAGSADINGYGSSSELYIATVTNQNPNTSTATYNGQWGLTGSAYGCVSAVTFKTTTAAATNGPWTTLTWDVVDSDTEDPSTPMFDSGSPTKISITTPGWYECAVDNCMQIDNSGNSFSVAFCVNGSTYYIGDSTEWSTGGGAVEHASSFVTMIELAAGDYLECVVRMSRITDQPSTVTWGLPRVSARRVRGSGDDSTPSTPASYINDFTLHTATSNYTAQAGKLYLVDCSSSDIKVTLPKSTEADPGDAMIFKRWKGPHDVILIPQDDDTVNGLPNAHITDGLHLSQDGQGRWCVLDSTNTGWVTY